MPVFSIEAESTNGGEGGGGERTEPAHDQVDRVVDCLYVQEEQAQDAVVTLVVTTKVEERVDSSGERTVQPTPALADQLHCRFRNVRFALGRLDVTENPTLVRFGDELEAEDAVLGQEHVCARCR